MLVIWCPNYVDELTLLLQLVIKSITASNQAVDLIGKFGNAPTSNYIERRSKIATRKVDDIAYHPAPRKGNNQVTMDNCTGTHVNHTFSMGFR